MLPIKFLFPLILLFMYACHPKPHQFSTYDFKFKTFEWDAQPYKFPSFIQDAVISEFGHQYAAWDYSYIGEIKKMHETWDANAKSRDSLSAGAIDTFQTYRPVDAIEHILKATKEYQVVIINEAHHMPQHRVFTTQLLAGLSEQGFQHLGLETYFASPKEDSIFRVNGYPTLTSGFYTKEPQFGQLLRKAHQSGFNLFGYESNGHADGKEREINQARNIEAYLKKHPNEKVMIHCGFAHAFKGDYGGNWGKAMAGRLMEFTGIDPLTINQTNFSERSQRTFEHPMYQITDVRKPTVYLKENNKPVTVTRNGGESGFDIAVFHPRTKLINGRPQWLIYEDRQVVPFAFPNIELKAPYLVFAYLSNEEIGSAVPMDIQFSETKNVNLLLSLGKYNIIVWNEEKEAVLTSIEVK